MDRVVPRLAAWLCLLAPVAVPCEGRGAPVAGSTQARARTAADSARAVGRRGAVTVDGELTEGAWRSAPVADDFVQARPREGAEPARRTEVRVLYDADALYVGARMHDEPSRVADQLVRRDGSGAFDHFTVELDPNEDNLTGYLFQVSAAGAERDAFLHDDSRVDEAFDAVWSSSVGRDSAGWTVEMRIPLSQIDFEASEAAQAWGVNFVRRRLASNSTSMLVLRSRTRAGRVSQFGRLTGLEIPGGGRALEVSPYVATRARRAPAAEGDPFFDGSSVDPRAGVDLTWSPRSNVTVDATVNPDFGQVEVDPADVNLTAFETFFPERRPFFTEDARLFDFPLSGARRTLFHSRRIGREPVGGAPEGAAFVDVPGQTTILGAAKATGRSADGLSVGALGAVTAEETGRAHFREPGVVEARWTESFVAQPRSEYAVLRVLQDFRGGGSNVGLVGAGVRRELPGSGRFAHLPQAEVAGGVDFQHQWGGERDRRYRLWGYVTGSWVHGSPRAVTTIQTDPNHNFQRPDADYLSVDSAATDMVGREWRLQIDRQSARHWTWSAWVNEVSPGYVVDGIGFAGSTLPRIDVGGQIRYEEISPGPWFRSWDVGLNVFHNFRHSAIDAPLSPGRWADARESGRFRLSGSFVLHDNWNVSLGAAWRPAASTERQTRGGPLARRPAAVSFGASVRSDPRASVNLLAVGDFEDRLGAGERFFVDLRAELRPTSSVELSLGPRYAYEDDRSQFVTATGAVPYEPTFGDRYVFADVLREEFAVTTRLDVAFTPDLSLQLFAQPLLATGDFTRYKQLARPRSFDFLPFPEGEARSVRADTGEHPVRCRDGRTCAAGDTRYLDLDGDNRPEESFAERDFGLRSLRGNAVLRWEYAPGSELFLVWQQDRRGEAEAGTLGLGRGVAGLLNAVPENVFILKLSHHLSL